MGQTFQIENKLRENNYIGLDGAKHAMQYARYIAEKHQINLPSDLYALYSKKNNKERLYKKNIIRRISEKLRIAEHIVVS